MAPPPRRQGWWCMGCWSTREIAEGVGKIEIKLIIDKLLASLIIDHRTIY